MLEIRPEEVVTHPFPHIPRSEFLPPELYARLKAEFPSDEIFDSNSVKNTRAGRDLYRGDAVFEEFMARSPAWREFFGYMNSPRFVELILGLFGPFLPQMGCRVDPDRARFVDYVEPREALREAGPLKRALRRLTRGEPDPNELFVRFDLAQGRTGYHKPIHCDLPNRLVSFVLYFCDSEEDGVKGGELGLHELLEPRPLASTPRYPRPEQTREVARLQPKDNLGVIFLCSNNSYHSVTPLEGGPDGRRNFIYMNVSSRAPRIW